MDGCTRKLYASVQWGFAVAIGAVGVGALERQGGNGRATSQLVDEEAVLVLASWKKAKSFAIPQKQRPLDRVGMTRLLIPVVCACLSLEWFGLAA
jgi:hypothetical protein